MKVFYHNDLDGKCSAAVIHLFFNVSKALESKDDISFIACDYNIPIKPSAIVDKDEEVWIVDYSFSVEEMIELGKLTKNIIWIDHHKTSIDKFKDFKSIENGYEMEGLTHIGLAGCELTWTYLMLKLNGFTQNGGSPNIERHSWYDRMPEFVALIGDKDVWRWEHGDITKYFNTGLLAYDTMPENDLWVSLFNDRGRITNIIEDGKVIERYKRQWSREYVESNAVTVEFEGYNCLACNIRKMGSEFFGDLQEKFDILIPYGIDKNGMCNVSLFSVKEDIDVSDIAKKFGGGGHKGASGFMLPYNHFLEMIIKG